LQTLSCIAPQCQSRHPHLIDAGAGRTLFLLTQTDPLRAYVNVPQSYAQLVKPGQQVAVTQAELRGQTFAGTVARTSASIDAAMRTMQIEISLPNRARLAAPCSSCGLRGHETTRLTGYCMRRPLITSASKSLL
jgi:hypothetical protein